VAALFLSDARACEFIATMRLPQRAIAVLLANDAHASLHLEGDTAFGVFTDWPYEADASGGQLGEERCACTDLCMGSSG